MPPLTRPLGGLAVGTLALGALGALLVPAAAHAAPAAPAAKPKPVYYSVDNAKGDKAPTKRTSIRADKKANTLHWASGDWLPKKAEGKPVLMRLVIAKPGKKPAPFPNAKWNKARDVTEITYVYRTSWDFEKKPVKLPNKTRVWVEIKGHGATPAITL